MHGRLVLLQCRRQWAGIVNASLQLSGCMLSEGAGSATNCCHITDGGMWHPGDQCTVDLVHC